MILAAAGPLWNPPVATSQASAPLALLIDDGWAAAATWDARLRTAEDLIARAEADNRGVAVVAAVRRRRATSRWRRRAPRAARLRPLKPKPHTVERTEALPALARFLRRHADVEIVWLSDGVDVGHGARLRRRRSPSSLDKRPITVVDGGVAPAHALAAADNAAGALTVKVLRAATGAATMSASCAALDLKGLPLGEAALRLQGAASARPTPQLDLPVEIRNDIARLEIAGERSAGAVQLLDKRWRRRTVGVVTGSTADTAQPLLASTYLPVARARPVRRRAARRARLAGRGGRDSSSTSACR